jgi:hypothetical protein
MKKAYQDQVLRIQKQRSAEMIAEQLTVYLKGKVDVAGLMEACGTDGDAVLQRLAGALEAAHTGLANFHHLHTRTDPAAARHCHFLAQNLHALAMQMSACEQTPPCSHHQGQPFAWGFPHGFWLRVYFMGLFHGFVSIRSKLKTKHIF